MPKCENRVYIIKKLDIMEMNLKADSQKSTVSRMLHSEEATLLCRVPVESDWLGRAARRREQEANCALRRVGRRAKKGVMSNGKGSAVD